MMNRSRRSALLRASALSVAFAASLLAAACSKDEPRSTRWADASAALASAAASGPPPSASAAPVIEGGALNKRFPPDGEGGMKRVFTQEKAGFAEAKLQKDGKDVATLSISDTDGTPDAKKKFDEAKEKLAGKYPLVTVGKNQSSVLVAGRWQVKVSSQELDAAARSALLSKFDIEGLAR
jgi:hypothetical protein